MSANAVVVLVGKKGSGKTSKLRTLVAGCRRILVADPEGSFELRPGDEVLEGRAALLSRVKEAAAWDPSVAFQWVYRDDPAAMPLVACGAAFVLQNLTFVADELIWFCNSHQLPPYLKNMLAVGRRRRINIIGTTREPQEIHDLFFSTADLLYFFHVDPGNGLDRIRKRYPKQAAELEELPLFEYRIYGDERALRLLGREGRAPVRARSNTSKNPTRHQRR